MKRICMIFILICAVMLSSCAKDTDVDYKNINIETDFQYYYRFQNKVLPMTESPDGYYYVGENGIVIYIDKASLQATPLCNKVNCKHNNENSCDAYHINSTLLDHLGDESLTTLIQYYDGHIYTIGYEYDSQKEMWKPYLKRINLDGTNSTKITNSLKVDIYEWMLHRGYFYYAVDTGLYRIPLDSPESESEIVFEIKKVEKASNNVSNLTAYKNYIYFMGREFDKDAQMSYSTSYVYDIENAKCSKVEFEGEKVIVSNFLNDNVLFQKGNTVKNKIEFYQSDLFLKAPKLMGIDTLGISIFNDQKYIYTTDLNNVYGKKKNQSVKVYDYSMKLVDTFKIEQCTLAGQNQEHFIVNVKNDLYAIDKSQIGTLNGEKPKLVKLCKLNWS